LHTVKKHLFGGAARQAGGRFNTLCAPYVRSIRLHTVALISAGNVNFYCTGGAVTGSGQKFRNQKINFLYLGRFCTSMAPEDPAPADHPGTKRSLKKKQRAGKKIDKKPARRKTGAAVPATGHECLIISGQGSCPDWEGLLRYYPTIDSIQREDFPDYGASFVYLAHFYRTDDTAEESARAQQEFEDFFKAIGYKYDYAGNFESRWFEGIGVKTG
jgi:hypothetical protein